MRQGVNGGVRERDKKERTRGEEGRLEEKESVRLERW